MKALIQNGYVHELLNLTDEEVKKLFHPSMLIVDCPDDAQEGWRYDGEKVTPPDPKEMLAKFLPVYMNELKLLRDLKLKEGFEFEGHAVPAGIDNLTTLGTLEVAMTRAGIPVEYKLNSGSYITLDNVERVQSLSNAMHSYIQKCYKTEKTLVAELNTVSFKELEKYNLIERFEEEVAKYGD